MRELCPAGIVTLHLFCRQSENFGVKSSDINVKCTFFALFFFFQEKINNEKNLKKKWIKVHNFPQALLLWKKRKQSGWMLSWKNSRVNMSVNSDLAWMISSQRKKVTHKTFLLEALRFQLINCSEVSFKLEVCQGRSSCSWNTCCCQLLLLLL